jgi:DNA-binding NarL/FixJ family response regulator
LMDINLPQKSGLDLCKEVKEKYPAISIIGLSTSNQASVIRKMQENGASGYLLKDASKNEIIMALEQVSKGKDYVSSSVADVLKKKTPNDLFPVLTRREKEILELISEGLTNQEIATKLFLNVTTIDSHRKNMLTKFNVKNTAALIKIAVSNQLI